MKKGFKYAALALMAMVVYSCNGDKSPTAGPFYGTLMDHCGGVIQSNVTLELWVDAVDRPGTSNDEPEAWLETVKTNSAGMFYFSDFEDDKIMSVRYNVPGVGKVKLLRGRLDQYGDEDVGTIFTQGSTTDISFTWTKDSTWTTDDAIIYQVLPNSSAFPAHTLTSNTTVINETLNDVPVYTYILDPSSPETHMKWELGVEYTYNFEAGSADFVQYKYFDLCPVDVQEFLVGTH